MKKIILCIILIYMTINIVPQTPPIPAEGTGTANDPYLIANIANLRWLSETSSVWGTPQLPVHITQTANIDASETRYWNDGEGFSPIGNNSNNFRGVYDGQRYTIDDLYICKNATISDNYFGFFGMAYTGTLKNICLINNDFTIYASSSAGPVFLGGILGHGIGYIENCYTTGSVSSSAAFQSYIGGITGNITGTLLNCFTLGDISASATSSDIQVWMGGLAGAGSGSISNCYTTGNITSNSHTALVGGIVGMSTFAIANCFSTGNITATYDQWVVYNLNAYIMVGGIAGMSINNINYCFSTGDITSISFGSTSLAGGIAGQTIAYSLTNCYALGNITAKTDNDFNAGIAAYAGGIAGTGSGVISNSYAKGNISSFLEDTPSFSGGITGNIDNLLTISSCFWDTQTTNQATATPNGTPSTNYGLPTLEMQNIQNYLNNGWDFTNIWSISSYLNEGYPFLKNMLELNKPVSYLIYTISENNVTLSWGHPAGITYPLLGYIVIRDQTLLTPNPINNTTLTDSNLENGIYTYIVFAVYAEGYSLGMLAYPEVNYTSIDDDFIMPLETKLHGNYPNPFNPETTIKFSLDVVSSLQIDIFNIKGQKIKTLVNEVFNTGHHSVEWDGTDSHGNKVPSGIYFYKMTTHDYTQTKKMMMVK